MKNAQKPNLILSIGIHPSIISDSFIKAAAKSVEFLAQISMPVDLNDRANLLRAATTSLNSKASNRNILLYSSLIVFNIGI